MLNEDLLSLQNGDELAFERIYQSTKNRIYAVCFYMLKDSYLAEDMMQETFIKIRRFANKYDANTKALSWITTIARNTCLNEIKARKPMVATDFTESKNLDKSAACFETPDENGIFALAKSILKKEEYDLIILHTIGGFTLKEVSEVFQKPQATTRWQYKNALLKLRKGIEKGGYII